jgi:hypothetical protein
MPPACALVALAASPTLDAAELAELLTLVRPSDALDEACAALSFTAAVASDVVEALRRPARRTANVDCRNTARDAARDIVRSVEGVEMARGDGVGVVMSSVGHVELRHCVDFSDRPSVRSDHSGEPCLRTQHHTIAIARHVYRCSPQMVTTNHVIYKDQLT